MTPGDPVRVLPLPALRRAGQPGTVERADASGPFPVVVRFADGGRACFRLGEVEAVAAAPCPHDWIANPGLLDFDDPGPASFACRLCGAAGAECPDCGTACTAEDPCAACGNHGVVPAAGGPAVAWARAGEGGGA